MKNVLLVLLLVLNQTGFADCPQDIQEVHKGETVNCDGLLFSPEASKKVDEIVQDAKYYKELADKLIQRKELTDKELNVLDQRLKLYQDQSRLLADQLTKNENNDKWEKIGYFSLGVLATGLSVYAATQLR